MQKSNTMRRVAGILYAVSFVAELFLIQPLFFTFTAVVVPMLFSVLLVMGTGVAAVWLLAGEGTVNRLAARAIAVATGLMVLKSLVLYQTENDLLNVSVAELLPSLAENNLFNYIVIILRLMLLIVAAFFVLNAVKQASPDEDPEDEGDAPAGLVSETIVEIDLVEGDAPAEAEVEAFDDEEGDDKTPLDEDETMNPSLPGNDR